MAEKALVEFAPASVTGRNWIGGSLIFAVAAFGWLRFSENTADNDLWGHVLYGQRAWMLGHVEQVETLSWTAAGQPWINHEYWAEVALGLVHRAGGGTALWLSMLGVAALTVFSSWHQGAGREPGQGWIALGLFAASVNFISLGYAVRPQLFTLLAFVALLALLRKFLAGSWRWALLLPVVFAVWVNFHGGYVAGWVLLILAGVTECIVTFSARLGRFFAVTPTRPGVIIALIMASTLALALNPWGLQLLFWTVQTILLPRPQITEWQPLLPSPANFPFYLVVLISVFAWVATRRPRRASEAVVLIFLALMAVAHRRHAPLFGLANLILTPPHLLDAARGLAPHFRNLREGIRRPVVQFALAFALAGAGSFSLFCSVTLPRERPWTIEVPRDTYPVSAIRFMREHGVTGNTVTFFDWGQQVLWELPHNPVSFDGRLDTVYSAEIMQAHWRFYGGEPPGQALDLARADVALLPAASAGVNLLYAAGWRTVYVDPLAVVLVKTPAGYPLLDGLALPVRAGIAAVSGRVPFPDSIPVLAGPNRPR